MAPSLILLLALVVSSCAQQIILTPGAFVKLNDSRTNDLTGTPRFGNNAASSGAFDEYTRLLYVVGTGGDVLNIILLHDMENPLVVRKVVFDQSIDGYPDAVALCRSPARNYLAISFEKLGTTSRAFVKIFGLLESPIDPLEILFSRITLDGYDPTGMVFTKDCSRLVVIQQGRVHKINNRFDDPEPYVDVLDFTGVSVTKISVPIIEANLAAAGVRHVLHQCENDPNLPPTSARDDLEPREIVIDNNDVVYISFPKNNALARLNLNAPLNLEYINAGTKEWRSYGLDTVDDDAINLQSYPVHTFFQPSGLGVFYHNNETYLASADFGEFMSLSAVDDGCQFDETLTGQQWITTQFFGGEISQADKTALRAAMSSPGELGSFRVTRQRYASDGYDSNTQGFNRVTGYGGRGISLLRPGSQGRVDYTTNTLEAIFQGLPEHQTATYNAEVGSSASTPSSRMDSASPTTGPTPRAIVTGELPNGQQVVVTANGLVGGLYVFPILRSSGSEPIIGASQGVFFRRGNPGLSWDTLYLTPGDSVGEPETKKILWIKDTSGANDAWLAVLGNRAGVVSFYKITSTGPF